MHSFVTELRFAVRSLRRSPGFTLVAVLTLALGIGLTTAIYTVVKRVVLDPLPYPQADRLVRLKNLVPGDAPDAEWQMAPAQYYYLGSQARSIEAIGAYDAGGVNLQTPEGAQRARAALVSASTLRMIGARTQLGRSIGAADDARGALPVAVLSDGFWRQEFGADPGVIGRTLDLLGTTVEVVGVLAPGAELPQEPGGASQPTDLWLPLSAIDRRFDPNGPFHNEHATPMFARLAPGVDVERAQAEIDRLTARLPEAFPQVYSQRFFDRYGFRTKLYPMKEYVVGGIADSLWILLGAVGLVLLIACANVANLLLVRAEGRRRELAIRTALGASRGALAQQFLAEGLVLALLGGALGMLLAVWGTRALVALAPADFPRLQELRVDGGVMLFALAVALGVALAVAALPILRSGRGAPSATLADAGRGMTTGRERHRARSLLVVAQVTLALVLIVGAGLLMESFQRLRAVDPGVDPEGVMTVELHLTGERYGDIPAMWRFYDQVLERVRSIPGVTAAGMSQDLPLDGGFGCTVQGFEDARVTQRLAGSDLTTCAGQEPTTPGYFEAMGIPLLRGRTFTDADNDRPAGGAVVVSRAFAERFWPGEEAIGKGVAPNGRSEGPFYHVVGVVGDVYAGSPTEAPATAIYYPVVRIPDSGGWEPSDMSLVVRTARSDPLALLPRIRAAVREVDPAIPISNAQEMQALVERSMSRVSFTMSLIAIAALMAMLLAAIGLYGVISYLVTRRTGEIGVRVALGAKSWQVERLVLAGSARLVAAGVAAGTLAALALTRVMRGLLYGVAPTHPTAYVAGSLALIAVALLASWIPARRAARVDPTVALRAE
jgi:predicted permease